MSPWQRQSLLQRSVNTRTKLVSSPPLLLAMVVVCSIAVGTIQKRIVSEGRTNPVLSGVSVLTYPFQWSSSRLEASMWVNWDYIFAARQLSEENIRLQSENARLRLENEDLRIKAQEADRLQAALNFAKTQTKPLLVAPVIGWLPSTQFDTITIGLGSRSGIKIGSIVRTALGLVGQVYEVGPFSAQVLLLSDVDSRVHVMLYRNGKPAGTPGAEPVGVLQGQGRSMDLARPLKVVYFKLEDNIKVGDTLRTSGYGSVFPPDIPVGTITEVTEDKVRFLKRATVNSYAPLPGTLREVLVIR